MTVTDDRTTELDQETASAAWPRVAVSDSLDVDYVPYLEFCGRVLRAGLGHVRQRSWATSAGSLEAVLPHAVSTSRWQRYETALLDLGGRFGSECLAYLWLGDGELSVRVAAHDLPALAAAEEWLASELPRRAPAAGQSVPVTFWSGGAGGGHAWTRTVDVPEWSAIERNYPRAVREALTALVAPDARPGGDGKLLLWHGEPGTGKTYALRALAWEWRSWCETHYVTDPEVIFGSRVDYLMDVVLREPADPQKWRVLVLEDTGELLAADAKERTGQGLSRLLNVVDGIFGQGLRLLVLVTTNEDLKQLHPAVARPGRCSVAVEFTAFPPDEAAGWLEAAGAEPEREAATLAALFARAQGRRPPARVRVGFELPR